MWRRLLFAALAMAATAFAQEGHPLSGTWTGDWGQGVTSRNHVTLVMNWDGEKVTGVINPGPDSIAIGKVSVDYTHWVVHLDADTKDAGGKPLRIDVEGHLEELGSPRRRLVGTWRQGNVTGDFRVTREQ